MLSLNWSHMFGFIQRARVLIQLLGDGLLEDILLLCFALWRKWTNVQPLRVFFGFSWCPIATSCVATLPSGNLCTSPMGYVQLFFSSVNGSCWAIFPETCMWLLHLSPLIFVFVIPYSASTGMRPPWLSLLPPWTLISCFSIHSFLLEYPSFLSPPLWSLTSFVFKKLPSFTEYGLLATPKDVPV